MQDRFKQIAEHFAAGDMEQAFGEYALTAEFQRRLKEKMGEFLTVLQTVDCASWCDRNAERTITFDTRRIPREFVDRAYLIQDGAVSEYSLGYIDERPRVYCVRNATVPAGLGMVATEDNTLLWTAGPWTEQRDYGLKTNGLIAHDPATGRVLARAFPTAKHVIPEGIYMRFGNKYFGGSLLHLASLAIWRDLVGRAKIPLIISGKHKPTPFELDAMRAMGLDELEIIEVPNQPVTLVERLWVPYVPVRWSGGQTSSAIAFDVLRQRLGVPTAADTPENVYITRQNARWRRMLNEDEIAPILTERGFRTVEFEGTSAAESVEMMKNAKVIIGLQGSNMTNAVFAPPGATIIEFVPTFYDVDPAVRDSTGHYFCSLGHIYIRVVCDAPRVEGRKYTQWDLNVSAADLRKALEIADSRPD